MARPAPRPTPRRTPGPVPRMADTFRELFPAAGDTAPRTPSPAETLVELTGEIADLAVKIAALDAARQQERRDQQAAHRHPLAATISRHVVATVLILVCGAVAALYLWLALGTPGSPQ